MATIKEVIPLDSSSLSGVIINATRAQYLANTTTVGTVVANACIVAGALKDIGDLRNITATGLITTANINLSGTLTGGTLSGVTLASGTTLTAADLNDTVIGSAIQTTTVTAVASKIASAIAIVNYVTASIDAISYDNMTFTGTTTFNNSVNFDSINTNAVSAIAWGSFNRCRRDCINTPEFTFSTTPSGPTNLILELRYIGTVTSVTFNVNPAIRWLGGTPPNFAGVDGDNWLVVLYFNGLYYYGSAGRYA